MKFKQQAHGSQLPEVNVIPMLTVMMGTVGYFVVVAITLAAQPAVEVTLPGPAANPPPAVTPAPLVVTLNAQGQTVVGNQVLSRPQIRQRVQTHLSQNPKASVLLSADSQLMYEQVLQVLEELRAVGSEACAPPCDRVSLAIEADESVPLLR